MLSLRVYSLKESTLESGLLTSEQFDEKVRPEREFLDLSRLGNRNVS